MSASLCRRARSASSRPFVHALGNLLATHGGLTRPRDLITNLVARTALASAIAKTPSTRSRARTSTHSARSIAVPSQATAQRTASPHLVFSHFSACRALLRGRPCWRQPARRQLARQCPLLGRRCAPPGCACRLSTNRRGLPVAAIQRRSNAPLCQPRRRWIERRLCTGRRLQPRAPLGLSAATWPILIRPCRRRSKYSTPSSKLIGRVLGLV